jgi:hypothetical protein
MLTCMSTRKCSKEQATIIGGKRGGSKGKPGGAKGYTTARAGTSNTRAAAQEAAISIQDQVAGMPAAAQAALLQTLTAALSKSVAEDKGGKRKNLCSKKNGEHLCS